VGLTDNSQIRTHIVLPCVAVCCRVLQWVVVSLTDKISLIGCQIVLQWVAVGCSVLQCVAVCCSGLQYVAVGWNVLQWVAVGLTDNSSIIYIYTCVYNIYAYTCILSPSVSLSVALLLPPSLPRC